MHWSEWLYFLGAGLMVVLLVQTVRKQRHWFSRAVLGQSFFTLGCLALFLIGVFVVCVYVLRSG